MSMNSQYPLISVVMATYNGVQFIAAQLDSILQQTYPNIEVIVVDDQSTDGSIELLKAYAEKHNNVKLYLNEKNLGYVKNFEKGMLLATGDFIAPSDQDDIWLPEKLSILMQERGDHTIVFCNSELINDRGEKVGKKLSDIKRLLSFDNPIMFAVGNAAPGHAMIIKKELVYETIPLPTMIPHDYSLGYMACFFGGLKYIDKPLVLYRQHANNVFGAVKAVEGDLRKKQKRKTSQNDVIRKRVQWLYDHCKKNFVEEKAFFNRMVLSYRDFSLRNNVNRVVLFYHYRHTILAHKRRSSLRKLLYSIKLFFKIE